jgi:hypothetical protein
VWVNLVMVDSFLNIFLVYMWFDYIIKFIITNLDGAPLGIVHDSFHTKLKVYNFSLISIFSRYTLQKNCFQNAKRVVSLLAHDQMFSMTLYFHTWNLKIVTNTVNGNHN